MHDFPNLFTVTGPQSPSVLYNAPLGIEDHIDYISRIIGHMREHGHTVVEPTLQAQEQWVTETDAIGAMTLVPETPSSYYMGANIPGKPRKILPYGGGAPVTGRSATTSSGTAIAGSGSPPRAAA